MSAATVMVTGPLPGDLTVLTAAGVRVVGPSGDEPMSRAEIIARVSEADGLICRLTDRIDAEVLAGGSMKLQVIANVAVGYDNIDLELAKSRGIAVYNTPGVLDDATADLTLALILAACRLTSTAEADLRAGRWHGWDIMQYLGIEVSGARLGLVGFGRIGRAVAQRAAAVGMRVEHFARRDSGEDGFVSDLDTLLQRSDVISLHVPLTPATKHLIDDRRLDLIGPTGVLINTSRGAVVDEAALARALHQGRVFAAGLDVYEREPAIEASLLSAPRAVLLPHIGSATRATRMRMVEMACRSVLGHLAGATADNRIV